MKLFNKKPIDKPFSPKVSKRVSKMSTQQLTEMIDPSLWSIGKLLSNYQRYGSKQDLENLLLSAEGLHAAIDAIYRRNSLM